MSSVFAPPSRWEVLIYKHIRVIHVIKISLALLIAHLIDLFYEVPNLAWTSVTIVIIMLTLPQVGGTLEKSIQRVIGTLCGATYGILILFIAHAPYQQALLALLGIAFVTWRASGRMSYAYLVAGFTLMIVLDAGDKGIEDAAWRTATILLGCCIAIGVSQFVLPLRARNEWRWLMADTLLGMSHIWQGYLSPNVHKPLRTRPRIQMLRRKVLRQKGMLNSVRMESRSLRACARELDQLVDVQERCLLLLELLAETRWENEASERDIREHYELGLQARALGERLAEWAHYCAGRKKAAPAGASLAGLPFKQVLQQHLAEQPSVSLNPYGYSWLIYQTSLQIAALEKLLRAVAGRP